MEISRSVVTCSGLSIPKTYNYMNFHIYIAFDEFIDILMYFRENLKSCEQIISAIWVLQGHYNSAWSNNGPGVHQMANIYNSLPIDKKQQQIMQKAKALWLKADVLSPVLSYGVSDNVASSLVDLIFTNWMCVKNDLYPWYKCMYYIDPFIFIGNKNTPDTQCVTLL